MDYITFREVFLSTSEVPPQFLEVHGKVIGQIGNMVQDILGNKVNFPVKKVHRRRNKQTVNGSNYYSNSLSLSLLDMLPSEAPS